MKVELTEEQVRMLINMLARDMADTRLRALELQRMYGARERLLFAQASEDPLDYNTLVNPGYLSLETYQAAINKMMGI